MQGDSNGNKYTSITDSRMYLRVGINTGRNYVVSNSVDLSTVSYIEVNWSGYLTQWNTNFWDANVTFGISNNAGDDSFVASINHDGDGTGAFGSFNKTEYLDVSSYTGSYFLKFGGELTKVDDFTHYLYMYAYDITAHNYTSSYPLNVTTRTTSSATLRGKVIDSNGSSCTCGFWYGNSLPLDGTNNVTCTGTYTTGQTFTKSIGSLTSGDYYYVQSWTTDSYSFNLSSNYSYFITLPEAPTNLNVNKTNANSVNIEWTNATVPAGTNLSVYIRWKNGSTPPSSRSDGNFGANISGINWTSIGSLPFESTVSFSAWTYINNSGSPSRSAWSESPTTTSGTTSGAIYNVTIRYENTSSGENLPVNLRRYNNHTLIIQYESAKDTIKINDSGIWEYTSGVTLVDDNTINGNFSISLDQTVSYFEFRWNTSVGSQRYCNRKIVPYNLPEKDDMYSLDFYIRTDLLVYPETTPYTPNPDGNGSIVKYTYGYIDNTGDFLSPENDAFSIIYTFNSEGEKMIIHSEYFDQEGKTHPWLVYQETYFQGLKCNVLEYERIGQAPATAELEILDIVIPEEYEQNFSFNDLINFDYGWNSNGIYIYYQDTSFSTVLVKCYIYGYYNNSLMDYEQVSVNEKYFYYTLAENVNFSKDYYVKIETTIESSFHEEYNGVYTKYATIYAKENQTVINNNTIDDIFNNIFGDSPLYNEDTNAFVPWTYIILFGLCFIEMTTFGKLNAFMGTLAVGVTLILSGVMISGISTLFSNYAWWEGPVLATIGIFSSAISIIGLIGGAEK